PQLASHSANACPHCVKEHHHAKSLCRTTPHHQIPHNVRSRVVTTEFRRGTNKCAACYQPPRKIHQRRFVPRVVLGRSWKQPERDAKNHVHHESHGDEMRVCTNEVAR